VDNDNVDVPTTMVVETIRMMNASSVGGIVTKQNYHNWAEILKQKSFVL